MSAPQPFALRVVACAQAGRSTHVAARRLPIAALPIALLATFGCVARAPEADSSPVADAPSALTAPVPASTTPLFVGPEIGASFAHASDPGGPAAGATTAPLTGPTLGAESVALEDTWTLPETPKSVVVSLRHAQDLEVRLDDPERLPWAARTVAQPIGEDQTASVELFPLAALAVGPRYTLVISGRFVDASTRTWTIPLAVEAGPDGKAPWQESPPAAKPKKKRR